MPSVGAGVLARCRTYTLIFHRAGTPGLTMIFHRAGTPGPTMIVYRARTPAPTIRRRFLRYGCAIAHEPLPLVFASWITFQTA
jgi:hypothetical protein